MDNQNFGTCITSYINTGWVWAKTCLGEWGSGKVGHPSVLIFGWVLQIYSWQTSWPKDGMVEDGRWDLPSSNIAGWLNDPPNSCFFGCSFHLPNPQLRGEAARQQSLHAWILPRLRVGRDDGPWAPRSCHCLTLHSLSIPSYCYDLGVEIPCHGKHPSKIYHIMRYLNIWPWLAPICDFWTLFDSQGLIVTWI